MKDFVAEILAEHKSRYGARRISKSLYIRGIIASHKRVAKVLSKLGLQAKVTRKRYRRSRKIPAGAPRMNLVEQVFNVDKDSVDNAAFSEKLNKTVSTPE